MIMIHNHLEVVTPGTVYILLYPDAIHLHADVVVVLDHLQMSASSFCSYLYRS